MHETRLCSKYIDELFEIVRNGKLTLDDIITHWLLPDEVAHPNDIFKKKDADCVKVIYSHEHITNNLLWKIPEEV
jgi:threonine dehydrogenase-like Zn-dependent dehydrogenase